MKSGLLWMLSGLIGFSASAIAQTTPICPAASDVQFVSLGPPPSLPITVLTPALPVQIYARLRPDPAIYITWDLFVTNAQFSGNAIALDGYVVQTPTLGVPPGPRFFSLGNLSAGNYTATVRPVATNITPLTPCPVLVVPFVVNGLPGSEPVPMGLPPLALLGGLLACAGLWFSRRRYRLR